MKKKILLITMLVLLFVFSGCSSENQNKEDSEFVDNVSLSTFDTCKENDGNIIGISLDQCEIDGKVYVKNSIEIIDLKECDSYFDGCNVCMITDNKIGGCTRMFCDADMQKDPECRIDETEIETKSNENICIKNNGKWLEEFNECEGISKNICEDNGGDFNECASSCRNKPDTQICTMQCVLVCTFD